MNALIVVHPVPKHIKQIISMNHGDFLIAVDQAVSDVLDANIKIDLVIGDLDSLKNHDLLSDLKVIKLDKEKDLTDTESAVIYAKKMNFSHITIVGGLGGLRFEHSYANVLLIKKYDNLTIITDRSKLFRLQMGRHQIEFNEYVNIFSIKDSIISLEGFKYGLTDYELNTSESIGISNEIENDFGVIDLKFGELLVILSKKD